MPFEFTMLKLKAFVMLIAVVLVLAPFTMVTLEASYAQPLQKSCDIQQLRTEYQPLSDKVEGVSPDMSSYIKHEEEKAFKLGNAQRFNNLLAQVSKPVYYADKFHKDMSELQSYLTAADEAKSVDDKIISLADALSTAGDVRGDVGEYIDADAERGDRRLLSPDDVKDVSFDAGYLKSLVSSAIKCLVRQQKQPSARQ